MSTDQPLDPYIHALAAQPGGPEKIQAMLDFIREVGTVGSDYAVHPDDDYYRTVTARLSDYALPADGLVRHDDLPRTHRESLLIAEDATYWYDAYPRYGFNARLVLTPKTDPLSCWEWGWCFPHFEGLVLAVAAWTPETQDEPVGWHKRPTYDYVRRAPQRDQLPAYNQPRCIHGHQVHAATCTWDECVHERNHQ